MRQFICGSDSAFANLERRACHACVVFPDQEMPPGAVPSRARVGFEIQPSDSAVLLLVDRGITYDGTNSTVSDWLAAGEKRFSSFGQLRDWIQNELGACYQVELAEVPPLAAPITPLRPEKLTDLVAVQKLLQPTGPLYLDEDKLFREMRNYVRGQDEALLTLARAVSRQVARCRPSRPATLFAVGPTGVGKTRTAESLPLALRTLDSNGAGYGYVRLDMAEYQERYRVSQLLGAPQGYIGYGEGSQLVDSLVASPKTIVLFDEIEKAHADVLRTLMNLMDAGRLSSAAATACGREIDCRHAIFLFTSNLDVSGILGDLEMREGFGKPQVVDAVCRNRLRAAGIKPELIGRIGHFLVFRPLTAHTLSEIVSMALARVAREYGLQVARIDPALIVRILDQIRCDDFGARPYEYLVDDILGHAFAQAVMMHGRSPVELRAGPPVQCSPLDSSEADPA